MRAKNVKYNNQKYLHYGATFKYYRNISGKHSVYCTNSKSLDAPKKCCNYLKIWLYRNVSIWKALKTFTTYPCAKMSQFQP